MIKRISGRPLVASVLAIFFGLFSTGSNSNEADLRAIAGTILELERELLIAERKLLVPDADQILTIYLDIADIPQLQLQNLRVQFNGDTLVDTDYDAEQNRALTKGGIHKIYQGPIDSGTHELHASFVGEMSDTVIDSKIHRFEKSQNADTITITIIDILRAHEPELTFHYARSIKQ